MQIYKKKWMKAFEDTAALQIIIFEILIHGVSTAIDVTNIKEMKDKIQWNNSTLETANVKYIKWLKKKLEEKKASTLIVKFDNSEHADSAIIKKIALEAQMFICEYYNRICKLRQCFKCQKQAKFVDTVQEVTAL
ncbi:uncharacterized protein PADG_11869 [Paracoccidioides brasiliensis Pb18]|uniref:Uncharacterized protein n=1 Tax=Paracoccidioides brasiliensis (strain Pb18) TaxID=502780 RepID=A0A0A0HUP4_PARBD|nr:uncharacterized protein PADG_11869 [Paracoccidioides brasiliensis Pb18]KGM92073.1 hypothetical protein PADG_11869 [Paracoccidioides brasiliensis Pb18]